MTHLEEDEIELMGLIAELDYEAQLEDPVLQGSVGKLRYLRRLRIINGRERQPISVQGV